MYPILFEIGPVVIRGYGVMLALSFLTGIYLALHRAEERGLKHQHMVNLCLIVIVSSIAGARLLYVIPHWEEFSAHPLDMISPFQSSGSIGLTGLTMYGGFIGAVVSSLWYLRRHKLPIWRATDAFAPSIALGIGITRIGCLLNGCCFGTPTDVAWGIGFPAHSAAGAFYPDALLHPAQVYNSVLAFGLFALLMALDRRERFDGYLFGILLIIEPIIRSIVDVFRYYESSMVITSIGGIPISLNQGISLVICGLGFFLLARLKDQDQRKRFRKAEQRKRKQTAAAGTA
ncbi:MAG: prolipoprotein diacylglyceryl transferase [Candidatus Latescibacteria bacterium]|mgnify:CR=1 FL=1|jgi:phosphatidylglycerol---prolipoprotein diacylglyceryl transferase|nr:prolipoprotein diacylglyceryl transferase [Candidatus Latescibacterota bacterium]